MNALTAKLINQIKTTGPISFRDFMASALYDPDYGYYCRPGEKIGRSGDYYTAANVDQTFGALLARQAVEMCAQLNCSRLTIVEIGAGTGQLAVDILTALQLEHQIPLSQIDYLICEASPVMIEQQQAKLAIFAEPVRWVDYQQLATAPITGVIIANEVVDALPVQRVQWRQGQLYQQFVTTDGQQLLPSWAPAAPALSNYLQQLQIELFEQQIIEISLDAIAWLKQIAAALQQGFLITIDYGDLSDHLTAPEHLDGTVRCFYRHNLIDDPFQRVGEQDITADVNFSALIEYGQQVGFATVKLMRQADYLIRLGLLERLEELMKQGEDFHSLKTRLALKNFFIPGGISDHFKVLIQQK